MANVNAPFGLVPEGNLAGSLTTVPVNMYYIVSTDPNAYYVGSPVIPAATADTNGVPGVIVGNGTDVYVGVVTAILPVPLGISQQGNPLALEQVSIPATKNRDYYVLVADNPLQIFEVQGDGTATNQVSTKANNNCSLTITAPSPASAAQSATVVSSSTIATNNTLNIRLMGLARRPGNTFGAYAVWRCKINLHAYANAATGI